jgi:hypothetical protein
MSRIQLEAACTITDERSGTEETYYLIAPCRSEHTHSDGCLFSMPNYDFRGIFGKDEHIIIRKHWVSEPAHLDAPAIGVSGSNRESWDEVRLDVRTFANERRLQWGRSGGRCSGLIPMGLLAGGFCPPSRITLPLGAV